ncbi:disintegrin and metalloproteinase domain-containing protein 12 isoform X2 [Pleurodeles waltl]|uniref:disintegrin and metalloproteinase domain-containing protein 12 isoform X2 n=1 Tax=Pleurodeles waltl TaxID=8319 RepID=UPI0037097150
MFKGLKVAVPCPHLCPRILLLLSLGCVMAVPAEGETSNGKLESLRQQVHRKYSDYEIIVPHLLHGQDWVPLSGIYLKSRPAVLKLRIKAEGAQLVISLERNEGLFAGSFTVTHYLEDGTAVTTEKDGMDHCYYHGSVQTYHDSAASFSTCSGLRGFLSFENKSYLLEPLAYSEQEHLIFLAENVKTVPGSCGYNLNHSGGSIDDTVHLSHWLTSKHKRDTSKMTKYVELIIVADNREFQRQGRDVEKVTRRLMEIANYVDKFFRPLNIRVALVGVEVWNDSDKCSITQDPFTSLHEFLDWRKLKLLPQKPHDNAQLVSGVYFHGTTIGMAPIMSMCTAEQSGGVVMDHSDNPLGAAVTLAHELGHNFGMNHDTLERRCHCKATADKGGCIMTPSTTYPYPTVFSSCSKQDLDISLEKGIGMCLFNMPEAQKSIEGQKCGNGYVEEGEECDCGELDECTNPCCNASTCTLKPDAVCAHGLCCQECKLKSAGISCREASNACDLPEFCTGRSPHCPANVYLHDGHPCYRVDGYCYNGICETHEQQCITLWGKGAKPAPGICFERVNSAGDPYGNCGKNSAGSFAKCESRDAKCGKIQCQGGANRPVIGTNAVSIETNIPLQEGGRILCRGTHVYLGDDMPDPGLVLAGTKCEDGKICLNRQCLNTSIFGVNECATKCHGHGVCNNKKNCHCDADWAPPFCDKPGLGGSVDSGPIRLADYRNTILGILVTTLILFAAALVTYLKRKTLILFLVANRKTTIEKRRSVGPTRSSCSSEVPWDYDRRLRKKLLFKPEHVQISKDPFKPSPPKKPLPADPVNKIVRVHGPSSTNLEHQMLVSRLCPVRPAPSIAVQSSSSSITAYGK